MASVKLVLVIEVQLKLQRTKMNFSQEKMGNILDVYWEEFCIKTNTLNRSSLEMMRDGLCS